MGKQLAANVGFLATALGLFLLSAPFAQSYPGNIVTITNTTINGNGVTFDSFDSADPVHSDWQTTWNFQGKFYGIYPANPTAVVTDTNNPAEYHKRKDNALVATCGNSLTVQNANIAGYLDVAPSGSAVANSGGYVGDVNWVFAPNGMSPGNATQSVEPGHILHDMPAIFPDVQLPAHTWTNITESSNKKVANLFTNSGYYRLLPSAYAREVNNSIYIKGTNINIWLPSGLNYSGNPTNLITLETNSDVTFYVEGNFDTGGQTTINNVGRYAPAFAILGLPDCTSINLAGSGSIAAWVYAPDAVLSIGAGGAQAYDSVGAFLNYLTTYSGHMNFHYDEALAPCFPTVMRRFSQTNRVSAAGSNITFSVSTVGVASAQFQWFFNQTNLLTGATNATLTLTNVRVADSGSYAVQLSNVTGVYVPQTVSVGSLTVYTNAAATLAPTTLPNGLQLNISGISGIYYSLQASTNLTDWVTVSSNLPPYSFTNSNPQAFPQCYYRVVCWPP